MNDQQAITRADRAKNELVLVEGVFDGLRDALIAKIEAGEGAENASQALQVMAKVRQAVRQMVADGVAAEAFVAHADEIVNAGFKPA